MQTLLCWTSTSLSGAHKSLHISQPFRFRCWSTCISTFAYSSYIIHSSADLGFYEVLYTRQYNPFLHICWFKNKTVTAPTCLNSLPLSKASSSETYRTSSASQCQHVPCLWDQISRYNTTSRIYFQAPGNKKSFHSSAWLGGDKARMIVHQPDLNSMPRLGEYILQYHRYYAWWKEDGSKRYG